MRRHERGACWGVILVFMGAKRMALRFVRRVGIVIGTMAVA